MEDESMQALTYQLEIEHQELLELEKEYKPYLEKDYEPRTYESWE